MHEFLDQLLAIAESNYSDDSLKATTLHQPMQMSRSSLHYKLKKHAGQSTAQFLANFRISKARILLTTTTASIKMITFQVGFKDPNYFSRIFKKQTGMSPSVYRKAVEHVQ